MKIGAMSIALARILDDGQEPTPERILRTAAEVGVAGVEFYETHWTAGPQALDQAASLRSLADSLGVEVFAIGSGARLGYADDRRADAVDTLRRQVQAAAAVGARTVTFPAIDSQPVAPGGDAALGGQPFARAAGPLVEQVRELAAFARALGVDLAVLNHCYFVCASWHQEWVVKLAGGGNVGACLDPGNYLYYDCEDPVAAARRLAGSVSHVRLGDFARRDDAEVTAEFERGEPLRLYQSAIFGEGAVDHAACLRLLRDGGYGGWLSLKSAGTSPRGAADALRRSLDNARSLVASLAGT